MAKDKLTDYDSTASGNLDVGGISVAEGMLPSGVNNAIRELMSHQADAFGAGTPLYVDQTNNRLGIGNAAPATALTVDADGATVATFDRATSDGTIIDVQKDGSTVGSIGTISGGTYIGSGDTGLFFEPVTNQIRPFNTSTVSSIDATIDLGRSTNRFKDLYLSGGVVFGTGGPSPITSNTLDDYEEGSWTATFAASTTTATGYYTKVGATVFFTVYGYNLNVTSTGSNASISGLPFTNNGGFTAFNITHDTYTNNSDNGYINSGGTIMYPIQDGTISVATTVAGNPKYIMVSGTYITDS